MFNKKYKKELLLSLTVFLLTLIIIECYLRLYPETLPHAPANYIASGYNNRLSGIYRYNPHMKMYLMRPNHERKMFFSGYTWHHKTDSLGFRNPSDRGRGQTDIVLLGDSMIYGHGVEETQTVRHFLEEITQKKVTNLGMQGACMHQYYQLIKNFVIKPGPEYVFLFFLHNDIKDAAFYLSSEEMKRFLNTPVHEHETPYFDIVPEKKNFIDYYVGDLYVARACVFFIKYLKRYTFNKAQASDTVWQSLPFFQKNPELVLAMKFHLYGLLKVQDIADRHDFNFIHVFIYTGTNRQEELIYEEILKSFCSENGIVFYSLKDDFKHESHKSEELFLKGDGHYSEQGSCVAAEALYKHFLELSMTN